MGLARVRSATLVTATAVALLVAAPVGATGRTAPGHLDPAFGTGGKVVLSLGGEAGFNRIVALSSGKLLAAGWLGNKILLMRFTATGHRDTAFGGGDGMVTTAFAGRAAWAEGLGITPTGRILVGGETDLLSDPDKSDVALVRYMPNGAIDSSFGGGDGRVISNVSGGPDTVEAVTIGPDGKAVALTESGGQPPVPMVARYTTSGSLDHTFSTDGKVVMPMTQNPFLEAVAVQADGKIVVAGQAVPGSTADDFVLYRLKVGGTPDTTFGTSGKVFTDFANDSDIADALAIDSSGRIVAAGAADAAGDEGFAVARYTPGGQLDSQFSGDGKVRTNLGPSFDRIFAVAITPGGKIVVGGRSNTAGDDERWALARYGGGGALDLGFGTGGKTFTNFVASTTSDEEVEGLTVEPGGRIVGAGFTGIHAALAGYAG